MKFEFSVRASHQGEVQDIHPGILYCALLFTINDVNTQDAAISLAFECKATKYRTLK